HFTITAASLFCTCAPDHPVLHSLPTRRSSDLVRPLGQVRLPEDHGARLAQLAHDERVLGRPRSHEGERARGRVRRAPVAPGGRRSEEHTSELQSRGHLVCRLLLEKKKTTYQ